MIGAVIYNGSNAMDADFPTLSPDPEDKLHSISNIKASEELCISDEDGNHSVM